MLVFSDKITNRLRYAVNLLFEDYTGAIDFTKDAEQFNNFLGPKLWYSGQTPTTVCLHVVPHGILFSADFQRYRIEGSDWNGTPIIFKNGIGDLPFDIFGASFFFVSRYEEYWKFKGDAMGRFSAQISTAFKLGILDMPIVDVWRKLFQNVVRSKFSSVQFTERKFGFTSTIDVDSAYAYLHKGTYRTLGGFAMDISRGDFKNALTRAKTLSGQLKDPYDTYDYIDSTHERYGVKVQFFFLVADMGPYDKGLPFKSTAFRKLISNTSKKHEVGVHPGVGSNNRVNTLSREKARIENITGQKCTASRQHYLMLTFRSTYKLLKSIGIKDDYSMGFAEDVGFRAGTSRPFFWFDIKRDETTSLRVHPFAIMDTTLNKYLKLSPEKSIARTREIMDQVKAVDGDFISLWHNETLSEKGMWKGWRKVWESTLEMGANR